MLFNFCLQFIFFWQPGRTTKAGLCLKKILLLFTRLHLTTKKRKPLTVRLNCGGKIECLKTKFRFVSLQYVSGQTTRKKACVLWQREQQARYSTILHQTVSTFYHSLMTCVAVSWPSFGLVGLILIQLHRKGDYMAKGNINCCPTH